MGVVHNYMFCALTVIVGIIFAQEYDSGSNMEMNILKYNMNNVIMELQDIKADLKVEKAKTIKLEKQVNTLIEENKDTKINNTDSDLPGHVSVKDQQQAMEKISSFIEQRVYQALNDEKMLRKQFQNQTQTDFKTEKENMENKFTVLNATLSAVIETKLQTIENKVLDSVIIINESISSIDNISRHMQQNGGEIISLRVESDQLNTTFMEHGALLRSLNDSIVVVQASVIELQNDSHQYKEDNSRNVQQNNKAINNLRTQTEYGKISLLRHDAALTSLNDTLVDIHASMVELRTDSRHYKEHNSKTVQQNNEAINRLLQQSQRGNKTLLGHDAALTSLNDLFVDLNAYVSVLYREHTDNTDYADCYDIHKQNGSPTGLYLVKPHGLNRKVLVMCDMDTDGGGWTVFQYRHDGSVDFYRNFRDYENGFGSLTSEFWLGLSYIQVMTSAAPTQLRIDVEAADGTKGFQLYDNFHLTKGPDYALKIGTSSGTIGDSGADLTYSNGRSFSTHDHDRDGLSRTNCAEDRHGGWWYFVCTRVNLNGQYASPGTTSTIDSGAGGMVYYIFKDKESLKSSKIMFRRK